MLTTHTADTGLCSLSEQSEDARMLIKMIAQSADAGPGGWNGLKRKLLHLDIDGSGAVNTDGIAYEPLFTHTSEHNR